MCEILAVATSSPKRLDEVIRWAEKLEHYGIAGFGWGVAWLEGDQVRGYRNADRLSADREYHNRFGHVTSTRYLVHLRRPSRLDTVQLQDTQPFVADGRFAFCHNGRFKNDARYRQAYSDQLDGRADSEVGFRIFEELLGKSLDPDAALRRTHLKLGGTANLGYLSAAGELLMLSAFPGNQMWRFRMGDAEIVSTELHSADDSLFTLVFPDSIERRRLTGVEAIAPS